MLTDTKATNISKIYVFYILFRLVLVVSIIKVLLLKTLIFCHKYIGSILLIQNLFDLLKLFHQLHIVNR